MSSTTDSARFEGDIGDRTTEIVHSAALAGLPSTCAVCTRIWTCLHTLSTQQSYDLGLFTEISSGCPGHTRLIQVLHKYGGAGAVNNDMVTVRSVPVPPWGHPPTANLLGLDLSIAHDPSVLGHTGAVRVLSPDWLDLEVARQWKQQCLSTHGDACNDTMGIRSERPAWLIDVQKNCIVSGRDCRSFVALSYVWGKHPRLLVDADTMALLQIPGALVDIPKIVSNMPPIIRHAMHLTAALEERYLWIDAICIVQGGGDTYDQLNRMGSFYASATLTIIAANGDSQSGLPGLEGVSEPRRFIQKVIPFGKERLVVKGLEDKRQVHAGFEYDQRGWTFQEYETSKRRLILQGEKLRWDCQHQKMQEDLLHGIPRGSRPPSDIALGFPSLLSLSDRVMHRYNNREFSYEKDALPGISGLLSTWSRTFTGGFLCGLPEMFFDRCLGWKPLTHDTNLRRRASSGQHRDNQVQDASMAILPSWSWLGWKGDVTYLNGWGLEPVKLEHLDFYYDIEETIPTTTWYTSKKARGGILRPIKPSWYESCDTLYKDFSRPLPQGWSRVQDTSPAVFPTGCGKGTFEHVKAPGIQWHYPFPVVDVANAPQYMPEQTEYLFCKTQRTRLFASRDNTRSRGSNDLLLHLDRHGDRIGELRAHNQELVESRLAAGAEIPAIGQVEQSVIGGFIEVVVIYESCVQKTERMAGDVKAEWWESSTEEFAITRHRYAVLWIGWEGGIAYRRGSGHVDKTSWGLSEPEEVHLILG